MKGLFKYAVAILLIIFLFFFFGSFMENRAPTYFDGFPAGFTVEVFGMVTEIAIIIIFINKLVEYRDNKRLHEQRTPILRSLRELITESHLKMSYLLLNELQLLNRPVNSVSKSEIMQLKSTHYFNLESLKRSIAHINKFQTTVASTLSGEDIIKIHEYLESLEYIMLRIEFYLAALESRSLEHLNDIKLDKLQIERCESFYLYVKSSAPSSNKEFFRSSMIVTLEANLPTASQLINLCKQNTHIRLVNSQLIDEEN